MDQLAALRLFISVARSKSISSAGRTLGLSTTTASKRLQDLEAALGVRLVDRTTRQLALTEAGERLLARSADMLDRDPIGVCRSQGTKGHTERYLAHRSPSSFGLMHVAPALPAFRQGLSTSRDRFGTDGGDGAVARPRRRSRHPAWRARRQIYRHPSIDDSRPQALRKSVVSGTLGHAVTTSSSTCSPATSCVRSSRPCPTVLRPALPSRTSAS